MTYTIAQDANFAPRSSGRQDWWRWRVWIDASDADLDKVRSVTWLLHPTFPQPEQTITDRATRFRLNSAGWGTFEIACEIDVDGEEEPVHLVHELELLYPEGEGRTAPRKGRHGAVVYMAYPSEASRRVSEVRKRLEAEGVQVRDGTDVNLGLPITEGVKRLIRESHAVIAIQDGRRPSTFILDEALFAAREDVPTLQFMVGGTEARVPAQEHLLTEHFQTFGDSDAMAGRILGFLDETE